MVRPGRAKARPVRRLYVPDAQLAAGAEVRLDAARSHRLRSVLRLRPGDGLAAFDGSGGEWAATVTGLAAEGVTLRIGEPVEPLSEPPAAVTLLCAFPRGQRGDWIVEKATELGVAAITPLASDRSVMQPGEGRIERWRRIAIEAAEQCGRASLPAFGEEPPAAALRLIADPGAAQTVAEAVTGASSAPAAVAIYIGPEGGWTVEERERLVADGALPVSLGPRRLRVETAAIVTLAQTLSALEGRGSRTPGTS